MRCRIHPRASSILASLLLLEIGAPIGWAELQSRWSFNEAAGDASNGTVLVDALSRTPMQVKELDASFDGARLTLPGDTTAGGPEATIAAYLDLPNGIISSKTDLILEYWAAPISGQNWAPPV